MHDIVGPCQTAFVAKYLRKPLHSGYMYCASLLAIGMLNVWHYVSMSLQFRNLFVVNLDLNKMFALNFLHTRTA